MAGSQHTVNALRLISLLRGRGRGMMRNGFLVVALGVLPCACVDSSGAGDAGVDDAGASAAEPDAGPVECETFETTPGVCIDDTQDCGALQDAARLRLAALVDEHSACEADEDCIVEAATITCGTGEDFFQQGCPLAVSAEAQCDLRQAKQTLEEDFCAEQCTPSHCIGLADCARPTVFCVDRVCTLFF